MNKKLIFVLLLISILYFLIFLTPNNTGADTVEMISVFEPDEFAQYSHVIRMLEFQGESIRHKLWHFVAYQHYYYGFSFYALSALALLPVKYLSGLDNVQLNMMVLRQVVSVLPMIMTFWILVYIQTRFENFWKSLLLFIILLSIPVVIKNNLWWHPDSLAILFCVIVILFLVRDNFSYGSNFYISAIFTGLAIGTKMLGWFFFLTIPIYLVIGILEKKIKWKALLVRAGLFLLFMFFTLVVSNPALIHPVERARYISIQKAQSAAMGFGWDVAYQKGPASWYSIISEFYGHWIFLLLMTISLVIGIINKKTRLTNILILSWIIPMLVYILFFVAIKPKHLIMPIALPFISCLVNIVPDREKTQKNYGQIVALIMSMAVLLFQFGRNVSWDYDYITKILSREETHPALSFYLKLETRIFGCLPDDYPLSVYRDTRAYVPAEPGRKVSMNWKPINYEYIKDLNPDIIVLQWQKIYDYTKPDILESARDRSQMQLTFDFYTDASKYDIENYQLALEDDYGLVFIMNDLSRKIECGNH